MCGLTKIDVFLLSGEVAHYTVDSVSGWFYTGGYLVVRLDDREIPYYLGDITHVAKSPKATVH